MTSQEFSNHLVSRGAVNPCPNLVSDAFRNKAQVWSEQGQALQMSVDRMASHAPLVTEAGWRTVGNATLRSLAWSGDRAGDGGSWG